MRNKDFSRREKEVFALMVEGLTDREVGKRLNISTETIKSHIETMKDKKNAKNRVHLAWLCKDLLEK